MPKSQYFCNFQEFRTMFKEMIGKDIKEYEMVERVELGKITPYLNYRGTAHFTKYAMTTNGIDYATDLFEEDIDIAGIFKLSSDSVVLSDLCIEANLGVGKPVAISQSLTESSATNSENALRSLGYCLYPKTNKINRKYSESELKCDLVFLKEDLLDIVSEYKNKQRCQDLEDELKENKEYIKRIERDRNLLEVEISRLKKKLRTTQPRESTEDLNNVKDSAFRLIFALKDIILGLDQESKVFSTEKKNKINFVNQSEIIDYIAAKETPKLSKSNIEKILTEANRRSLD